MSNDPKYGGVRFDAGATPEALARVVPEKPDSKTQLNQQAAKEFLAQVSYKPGYAIELGRDTHELGGRFYLQASFIRPDIITFQTGLGYGGKVYISMHMTIAELSRKAFQAFLMLEEHECREWFQVDLGEGPRRVFGPHISLEALYEAARHVDVRRPK